MLDDGLIAKGELRLQPEGRVRQVLWSTPKRLVFRFVFSYLCLYYLDCAAILVFFLATTLGGHSPFFMDYVWRNIVPWVGRHLLHIQKRIVPVPSDSTFAYVLVLCEFVLALIATVIWSLLDRRRLEYRRLHQWLRLVVQLLLAGMMFAYGFDKVFLLQFGKLTLSKLTTQFGDMSPFSVLWNFMVASKAYTIFCGVVEVIGGVLLLIPQLTTIGAMVCFATLSNVFVLNLSYDVPVK